MEYYSAAEGMHLSQLKWVNLECVIQSGVSQKEKNKYHLLCIYIGEGNGTPLWYSCLENPMDGGASWAAELDTTERLPFTSHFHALEKEMATHSSVLAWRIPGMGSLVGCHLWGRTESDTTEAT